MIYLDHAATTPLDPEVLDAMLPYLREQYGNASSVHRLGQRARGAIDEARAQIASLIGARDSEIVFTGGGTEADNMAVAGSLRAAADSERTKVVSSAIEHHAILNTLKALDGSRDRVRLVSVDESGVVDPAAISASLDDKTALVSIMFVNNETGVIQPIDDIGRQARERGATVHTDAVQALAKVPIDVARLNVDLMTMSAHKIHGPKGVGALYVRSGTSMSAFVRGGSQERNRRAGTENVAGIVGFGKAAELARQRMPGDTQRIAVLRDRLENGLLASDGNSRAVRNGAAAPRISSTTNLSFDGVGGEELLIALDMAGVAVSTGSACAAGSSEPSHVLSAMGFSRERVNSSLRFSLGRGTTEADIDQALAAVKECAARLRKATATTARN